MHFSFGGQARRVPVQAACTQLWYISVFYVTGVAQMLSVLQICHSNLVQGTTSTRRYMRIHSSNVV
jgi:hypothetical protein